MYLRLLIILPKQYSYKFISKLLVFSTLSLPHFVVSSVIPSKLIIQFCDQVLNQGVNSSDHTCVLKDFSPMLQLHHYCTPWSIISFSWKIQKHFKGNCGIKQTSTVRIEVSNVIDFRYISLYSFYIPSQLNH